MKLRLCLMYWCLASAIWFCSAACVAQDNFHEKALMQLQSYHLTWDSPSENSWGSMPLGNGDIGVNFWVEPNGDVVFYISKTDAWCENTRLLKLGKIRIKFDPCPVAANEPFTQTLNLTEGCIVVQAGKPGRKLNLRFWIDAHHPVIRLHAQSEIPVSMRADLELWRTERRELSKQELHSALPLPAPVFVEPDIVFKDRRNELLWCHRNQRSPWDNLGIEQYPELNLPLRPDPLLHRTFGCLVKGDNLKNLSEKSLITENPAAEIQLHVYALTAQTDTLEQWETQVRAVVQKTEAVDPKQRFQSHLKWWKDFWTRSWIFINGDDNARAITQGYILQRFMNACAGRGSQPIKFNGSIFTMDLYPAEVVSWPENLKQGIDADFRLWGGMYWWQNTRLIYWTMLNAGDFDLMQPFFKTYFEMLPLAKARAKIHYNSEGAVFWETIPWYGFNISSPPVKEPGYVSHYFQGGLEMAAIMMAYVDITQDEKFLKEFALPFAKEVAAFYFNTYRRDENGFLRIEPAQALETYWEVINPTPEIAGLDYLTERLLGLPEELVTEAERKQWQAWRKALPPYANRILNGVEVLSPAVTILKDVRNNMENPEMYAIFPYQRFGLGRDTIDLARRTYENRIEKRTGGWFYDGIMAAYVGLADEAASIVHRNFTVAHAIDPTDKLTPMPCRFPNFLGPNYDWVPDQDQPSVAMIALQRMLLQEPADKILVLPAWPKHWNVFFKLHANAKTTVIGDYRNGTMDVNVNPIRRSKDVKLMLEPTTNNQN